MKSKLLKTFLPLAAMASVVMPSTCLASCGKVTIVGPETNDFVGSVTKTTDAQGQDIFISSVVITSFALKDKSIDFDEIHAWAKFNQSEEWTSTVNCRIVRMMSIPAMFKLEIYAITPVPDSSKAYSLSVSIFKGLGQSNKIYENDFNITFYTQAFVPMTGTTSTLSPGQDTIDFPGFYINASTTTVLKVDVTPWESDWPKISSDFIDLVPENEESVAKALRITFSEGAPDWKTFTYHHFGIKIFTEDNGEETILFEDPSYYLTINRAPSI